MDQQILEVGISLATLAAKGTVSAVGTKIKSIKTDKDLKFVRNSYDEIINDLLAEREEAIRIAQIYKSEFEKIEISDENIVHLHNTVDKILDILKNISPGIEVETYRTIKELISVDILKSLQLLGFNFKAALGEPFTQWCASAILKNLNSNQNYKKNK